MTKLAMILTMIIMCVADNNLHSVYVGISSFNYDQNCDGHDLHLDHDGDNHSYRYIHHIP